MLRMCYAFKNKLVIETNHCYCKTFKPLLKNRFLNHSFQRNIFFSGKCSTRKLIWKFEKAVTCRTVHSNGSSHETAEPDDCESVFSDFTTVGDSLNEFKDEKASSIIVRNFLYSNSTDPLINMLQESSSEEQVFQIINDNYSSLNSKHIAQAIIVLRDLQVLSEHANDEDLHRLDVFLRPKNYLTLKNKIEFQLDPTFHNIYFQRLLNKAEELTNEFSTNALATSVLYLYKLGVPLSNKSLSCLFIHLEKLINQTDFKELPSCVFSMYSSILHLQYGLWAPYFLTETVCAKAIKFVDICDTFSDLEHVVTFFQINFCMVSESLLKAFQEKIKDLLNTNACLEMRSTLKVLHFLNHANWRSKNYDLILQILNKLLKDDVPFSFSNILSLTKLFPGNTEPYDVIAIINKEIPKFQKELDSEEKILIFHYLKYVASNYSIKFQHNLVKEVKQNFFSQTNSVKDLPFINFIYEISQFVKTTDKQLYLTVWSRTLKYLENAPDIERQIPRLLYFCNRYLMFNSKNRKIRHYEFERKVNAWIMQDLHTGIEKYIPKSFSRTVAFLLAYGDFHDSEYPDNLIKTLIDVIDRISVADLLFVSVSLSMAMEFRRKQRLSSVFFQQFVLLNSALNQAFMKLLKESDSVNSRDLGFISYAFKNRCGLVDSDLFSEIVKRYKTLKVDDLTPRIIRDAAVHFLSMNYFVPELMETMAEFVVKYNVRLKASFVEYILYLFFNFGFTPKCAPKFFPIVLELINRDEQDLKSLALIRAAMSLTYFFELPQNLIQDIFNVKFLDTLDEEIKLSTVKVTYPKRVRNLLMELNRAVCLDYPHQDIPWFHARYCEEIAAVESLRMSPFHEDVFEILASLLGNKKFIGRNVYSPYSYKIDFEILFDRNEKPIEAKLVKNPAACSRVAILLLQQKDLASPNDQLKGLTHLRQRHLELMGYQVVSISPSFWNTMFMTEKLSKADFLEQQIWPKHNKF